MDLKKKFLEFFETYAIVLKVITSILTKPNHFGSLASLSAILLLITLVAARCYVVFILDTRHSVQSFSLQHSWLRAATLFSY